MTIQTTNWHDRAKSVTLPSRPFIDGAYVDARTNETFDCIFPGDGRLLVKRSHPAARTMSMRP